MRECDIGTYHEPPPVGYGYDLPNFSCTICVPKPSGQCVQKSPLCSGNLTLQIQSPWPMWFCAFFWCTRNFGKKHVKNTRKLPPVENLYKLHCSSFCHSSYIFQPPQQKNLLWFPTVSLAPVFVGAFVSLLNKNPSNEFGTFDQLKVGLLVSLLNLTLKPHRIRGGFHHPFSTQDPQFLPWKKTDQNHRSWIKTLPNHEFCWTSLLLLNILILMAWGPKLLGDHFGNYISGTMW